MPIFTSNAEQLFPRTKPKRIVSVVPSQTELLFLLGLDSEVIGITKFCVHPPQWHQSKKRIGGTKNIDVDKVLSLNPDLIIANYEENERSQILNLAGNIPVWVTDVKNLEEAKQMIRDIGSLTGTFPTALEIIRTIDHAFSQLPKFSAVRSCAYLIWKDPFMTVGSDTFISDMLGYCGMSNAFRDKSRYPITTLAELQQINCDYLFLSSEPYPFKHHHERELSAALPHTKVILVDGEMFSWYGSRLQSAPAYFKALMDHIGLP